MGGNALGDGVLPLCLREGQRRGESAHEHHVGGAGTAGSARNLARGDEHGTDLVQAVVNVGGHREVAHVHRDGHDLLVVHKHRATLAQELLGTQGLHGLEGHHHVGAAGIGDHGLDFLPHADDGRDRAPTLAHAVNLRDLDVEARLGSGHGEDVSRKDGTLTTHAHEQDRLGALDFYVRAGRGNVGDG